MPKSQKSIFSKLRNLFSNRVIIKKNYKNRVKQYSDTPDLAKGNYSKIRKASYSNFDYPDNSFFRTQAYQDYDNMDKDAICSAALSVYASESLIKNENNEMFEIETDNLNLKEDLHILFYDILKLDLNLYSYVRTMLKYGDAFYNVRIGNYGIEGLIPMDGYAIQRVEEKDRTYFTYDYSMQRNIYVPDFLEEKEEYEIFEIAHFRFLSNQTFFPYGTSIFENARRTWKQLYLMEDAMLLYRILRAPPKRVFYIYVGSTPANEIDAYVEKVSNQVKKVPYIDPTTGDYDLNFNITSMSEDFFIPFRDGESRSEITPLEGGEYINIDDIQYLQNKLIASLMIPKAFLSFDEGLPGKATLTLEDLRFARQIENVQKCIENELKKLAIIHLSLLGYSDEALLDFDLHLPKSSVIYDSQRIENLSSKVSLAQSMIDSGLFSSNYVYKKIFKLTDEEIYEIRKEIINDKKAAFRREQIEQGNDPLITRQSLSQTDSDKELERKLKNLEKMLG